MYSLKADNSLNRAHRQACNDANIDSNISGRGYVLHAAVVVPWSAATVHHQHKR